jgi:OOP family OmpA-OmpF porin
MLTPSRRSSCRGGALVPILFIVIALAISAAVFFLFTKKHIDASREAEQAAATVNEDGTTVQPPSESTPVTATDSSAPSAASGKSTPAPATMTEAPTPAKSPSFGFTRAVDVAEQLTRSMSAGDTDTAAKLIAAIDPEQEGAMRKMLEKVKEMGFKTGPTADVQVIGQVENAMRFSIPLLNPDGTPSSGRLQLDVEKDPKMGWKISTLHLPKELEPAVAAAPMPAALPSAPTVNPGGGAPLPAKGPKPLVVVATGGPDAITFASDFVRSLLKLDYETARRFVDEEKVPPVKLAGLCIVFEDGKYSMQENKPLLATIATDKVSWIIAKVKSALRNEETEFGIEMEKQGENWRIIGLNLSKLLADNAKSSSTVGVPYTPLVQNPRGGECVALYFEYDSDLLHPRAKAQLNIVASVLKNSPGKKLKITGHTDAKGSDPYNISLSQRRAVAVKQFFIEQGVPEEQVVTTGIGKAVPLSPNVKADGSDNPVGRSHNRRAEILLDF